MKTTLLLITLCSFIISNSFAQNADEGKKEAPEEQIDYAIFEDKRIPPDIATELRTVTKGFQTSLVGHLGTFFDGSTATCDSCSRRCKICKCGYSFNCIVEQFQCVYGKLWKQFDCFRCDLRCSHKLHIVRTAFKYYISPKYGCRGDIKRVLLQWFYQESEKWCLHALAK